jgi:methyl-accepting chemotaxis protein
MFEWLTNLFHKSPDVAEMADQGIQKAQEITSAIPSATDAPVVDAVAEKVQQVTDQFEQIKEAAPAVTAPTENVSAAPAPAAPSAAPVDNTPKQL